MSATASNSMSATMPIFMMVGHLIHLHAGHLVHLHVGHHVSHLIGHLVDHLVGHLVSHQTMVCVRWGKKLSATSSATSSSTSLVTLSTSMPFDTLAHQAMVCVRWGKNRDERTNEQGDFRSWMKLCLKLLLFTALIIPSFTKPSPPLPRSSSPRLDISTGKKLKISPHRVPLKIWDQQTG